MTTSYSLTSDNNSKTIVQQELSTKVGSVYATFPAQILKTEQGQYHLIIDSSETQNDRLRFGGLEEKTFRKRFIAAHNLSFPNFISNNGFDVEEVIEEFPTYIAKLKINQTKLRKKQLLDTLESKADQIFNEHTKGRNLTVREERKEQEFLLKNNKRYALLIYNINKRQIDSKYDSNFRKPTFDTIYNFLLKAKENAEDYIYSTMEWNEKLDPEDGTRAFSHSELSKIIDNLILSFQHRGKVKQDEIFDEEIDENQIINKSRYIELYKTCIKDIDLETGLNNFYQKADLDDIHNGSINWEN